MFFNRKIHLILVSFALCVLSFLPGCSNASKVSTITQPIYNEQMKELEAMSVTSGTIYNKAKEGYALDVKNQLQILEDQVSRFRFIGITSLEGFHALSDSIIEAKRIFNAVRFSQEKGIVATAKIYMAIDAMTHPQQPIWLSYYMVLREDTDALKSAVSKKQWMHTKSTVAVMYEHYSVIRPSVMISRDETMVEQVDSLFAFMKSQVNSAQMDRLNLESGINHFYLVWDQIFMKKHNQVNAPVAETNELIIWTMGIGSVIVLVLAFVGWRKYQVQKDYIAVRKQRKGDGE